jgi:hypothetical protein
MASTPFSLHPSPIRLIAPAVAIDIAALAIIAAARTVPTLTLSLVKAALVEAKPLSRQHLERRVTARQFHLDLAAPGSTQTATQKQRRTADAVLRRQPAASARRRRRQRLRQGHEWRRPS